MDKKAYFSCDKIKGRYNKHKRHSSEDRAA